ncbi:hypothetical protein [Oceanithermus desulfurans]
MLQKTKYTLFGIFLAALGLWGLAVTIPNSFSSGEVVSASKMNQNFQALKAAVDQLESKVATLEANWAGLPTRQGFPRAYVGVRVDGVIYDQFSTTGSAISVNRLSSGRYLISFGDENVYIANDPALVVPTTLDRVCKYGSATPKMLVECQDLSGAYADSGFWVVLFNDGS